MRLTIIGFLIILSSCNGSLTDSHTHPQARGAVHYGGTFHTNETEYFRSLFPQNVTETVGHHITNQLYEGLLRLNQGSLSIEPSIASSWQISDSARKFVFTIRSGVRYTDDPCFPGGSGRAVTAHDFAYCFERLCTPSATNQGFFLFKDIVLGANAYFADKEKGINQITHVAGITAPDDTTLVIQLTQPFAGFLYRLAMPFTAVFPQEAYDKYGIDMREHAVGTGPFQIKRIIPDVVVFLERNPHYWGIDSLGNQLPYLDAVRWSFIKDEKVEMLEFKKGDLDMKYRLPLDMVRQVLDSSSHLRPEYSRFQLQTVPELATQFYGFLHTDATFSNVHVRRAINYAIDRQRIVNYTLNGEGVAASGGIVPIGMSGYHHEHLRPFTYDPVMARKELTLAGFPDGKGFPALTLNINSGGGRNEKVAEAISGQIEAALGIHVDIAQALWAQHTENSEMGRLRFWRFGWVADYPDPENFLSLYYGKNVPAATERAYLNPFRYKNPEYDRLFEKAMATADFEERNKLYEQLTQIGLDDAVTLNIFYSLNRRLLQPWVHNFPANGMEYRLLRDVWIDK